MYCENTRVETTKKWLPQLHFPIFICPHFMFSISHQQSEFLAVLEIDAHAHYSYIYSFTHILFFFFGGGKPEDPDGEKPLAH